MNSEHPPDDPRTQVFFCREKSLAVLGWRRFGCTPPVTVYLVPSDINHLLRIGLFFRYGERDLSVLVTGTLKNLQTKTAAKLLLLAFSTLEADTTHMILHKYRVLGMGYCVCRLCNTSFQGCSLCRSRFWAAVMLELTLLLYESSLIFFFQTQNVMFLAIVSGSLSVQSHPYSRFHSERWLHFALYSCHGIFSWPTGSFLDRFPGIPHHGLQFGFQEVPFYPRSLPLTVNRAAVHVSAHSALEAYGRVAYVTPLLVPAAWGHGGLPHIPINQLPELRRKQKHPCLYCDKHFDWPSTLRVRSHAIPAGTPVGTLHRSNSRGLLFATLWFDHGLSVCDDIQPFYQGNQ